MPRRLRSRRAWLVTLATMTTGAASLAALVHAQRRDESSSRDDERVSARAAPRPLPDYVAPPIVARTHHRYFSNEGHDGADGRTPQTAWRDVWTQVRRGAIPDDTHLWFVGARFDCRAPRGLISTAQADTRGTPLPTGLTFAPASREWRGTTLVGPSGSLNAFTIWDPLTRQRDGVLDWQIWGLGLREWQGTGVVTIAGRASGISLDGLFLTDNGQADRNQYHDIYLAGSKVERAAVPHDIRIRGCTSIGNRNAGFFLHVYNGDVGFNPTQVLVEGNVVTRTGNGGILLANAFLPSSAWTLRQNDVRVDGTAATLTGSEPQPVFALYFYVGSGPKAPADDGLVLQDNLFAVLAARPDAGLSMPSAALSNPAGARPRSSRNQFYVPAGRQGVRRFAGGDGDVLIDTLPRPMRIVAPPRSRGRA